jgi:hypothetical protein
MKVIVRTLLTQELEVPEGWDKLDVFDFLAENQSFRTAFQGVSNEDQTARITDVEVADEEVIALGDTAFDQWIGNTSHI